MEQKKTNVQAMQKARKRTVHVATADNLQAQIDLAEHIQVIAAKGKQTDVGIKNIRNTRKRERSFHSILKGKIIQTALLMTVHSLNRFLHQHMDVLFIRNRLCRLYEI